MQCACHADFQRCFVYHKQGFMLEYNAKVQFIDSGAVEYSAAICAFALSFLIQGLCIPELFWLLTAPVINMYIVPKASAA